MINNNMNLYENYITALLEDKPIGSKNREIWQNYLERRYMSRDDVEDYFVTFVSEDKVGINPKSIYDTPNGVYTYPVAWVLDNIIPFRGREKPKKIKVLKILSKKVLSDKLGKEEYTQKIIELQKEYSLDNKFIESVVEDAKVNSYFGKLWNVTRVIAKHLKNEKTSNIWTTILLHLGYDVVSDSGTGVIHSNEKTQTVFLNPKSYKVAGEEFVDTEERYKKTNKLFDMSKVNEILNSDSARNIYFFLDGNVSNILNLVERADKVRIFIKIMKAIYVDVYEYNKDSAIKLLKKYRPLIEKIVDAYSVDNFSFFDHIPHKHKLEFIETYKDIVSEKVFKNLVRGNCDILDIIEVDEFIQIFSNTIVRVLKEYEVVWLEAMGKSDIIKVYKKYKKSFKEIYDNDPDLIPFDYIKDMIEEDF